MNEIQSENRLLVGLYNNRIFTLKNGKTRTTQRKQCKKNRVEESRRLEKAIRNYSLDTDEDYKLISKKSRSILHYFNPYGIIPCQQATLIAIESMKLRLKDMYMITIIEGTHETNNKNFKLDLDVIKQDFQRGMKGYNFIGMIELAYFKNATHEVGEMIAPHFQGLMWGELKRRDKEHFNTKVFSGGRNNAIGFKATKIYDIIGAASYMIKLPVHGYKLRSKYKKQSSYSHTSEYLSYPRLHFLFEQLKSYTFEDMLVSGGEGDELKQTILNSLREIDYKPI